MVTIMFSARTIGKQKQKRLASSDIDSQFVTLPKYIWILRRVQVNKERLRSLLDLSPVSEDHSSTRSQNAASKIKRLMFIGQQDEPNLKRVH